MPVSRINGVNISWQRHRRARAVGGADHRRPARPRGVRSRSPRRSRVGHRVMLHDRRNTGASDHSPSRVTRARRSSWTPRPACIDGRAGRPPAGLFQRRFVGGAHLHPVLPALPGGGAPPAAAARHRRRLRGRPPAGELLWTVHPLPRRKAGWRRCAPPTSGRRASEANPDNAEYLARLPAPAVHRRADTLAGGVRRRGASSRHGGERGRAARRSRRPPS